MQQKHFYKIAFAACTDKGLKKKTNQDRFVARKLKDGMSLFAVIDGLGGQAGGKEAAEVAVDVLNTYRPGKGGAFASLTALMQDINTRIIDTGNKHPELYGMGATGLILQLSDTAAHWVHTGDCRLYYLHKQRLQLQTQDQNLAWELYAEGKITEEERQKHPLNCFLSQCLGEDDIEPVTGAFSIFPGDRILLCTDGVHDLLSKEQIEEIVLLQLPIQELVDRLCKEALEAGGKDNITLICIEVMQ